MIPTWLKIQSRHAAQADKLINEARIVELEDKLAHAEVIDVSKLSGDAIKFGATVTLINEDTDEKKVWRIVGEPEANANSGKISVNSPIARSLNWKGQGRCRGGRGPNWCLDLPSPKGGMALMRAPRHAVIAMMALARVRLTHRGQLSLLHELVPNAAVIALLVDVNVPEAVSQVSEVQAAARTLGLQLVVLNARTASDIDMAFASFMRERASALVVGAGGFFVSRRDQIIALAARHAIPAIYGFREYFADGGWSVTETTFRMPFAERASIPGGFSKARNRLTFRSCDLPNSS